MLFEPFLPPSCLPPLVQRLNEYIVFCMLAQVSSLPSFLRPETGEIERCRQIL